MATTFSEHILYLCRQHVEVACEQLDAVEIIQEAFKLHATNRTILPEEAYLAWQNPLQEMVRSLGMPAYIDGSLKSAGTKIINSNTCNPQRNLPRASGVTLLFDPITTCISCIMEGAYLSSLRTACVTAVATRALQYKPVTDVAIIGAGVLALAHIQILAKYLPHLHTIWLFDVDPKKNEELHTKVQPLLAQHNIVFQPTASAEEAIRQAQLIVPVTTTTQGYIQFDWLQPGSLLVHISLDDVLPEVVLKANKVIVDDWHLIKNDTQRLIGKMYRAGQVTGPGEQTQFKSRPIDAQLGDILTGQKTGREHEDEIILVNPFGLAIEDIALATHVYQTALKQNLGIWLDR